MANTATAWDRTVLGVRLFTLLMMILSVIFVEKFNKLVESIWRLMYHSPIVRHDSFEPLLSTFSFFVWINIYRLVDFYNIFPSYRINDLKKSASNRSGAESSSGRSVPGFLRPLMFFVPESWRGYAAVAYLCPLMFFDMVYPRRDLPEQAPPFHLLIGSVFCSIVLYDFSFYWIHYAMHHVKGLQHLHKTHHSAESLCAVEVIHHGLIDGTLQVLHAVAHLNASPRHTILKLLLPCLSATYYRKSPSSYRIK